MSEPERLPGQVLACGLLAAGLAHGLVLRPSQLAAGQLTCEQRAADRAAN